MKYMIPVTVEVNPLLDGLFAAEVTGLNGRMVLEEVAYTEADAWAKIEEVLNDMCARRSGNG